MWESGGRGEKLSSTQLSAQCRGEKGKEGMSSNTLLALISFKISIHQELLSKFVLGFLQFQNIVSVQQDEVLTD